METGRKLDDGHLVGLIADEKTCIGFLLAGIGECDKNGEMNFLSVDETTTDSTIENFFNHLCDRHDIALLLIDEDTAKRISQAIKCWQNPLPIILEIPSSNQLSTVKSQEILSRALEDSYI